MLRTLAASVALFAAVFLTPALAQDPAPEFPEPIECFAPLDDTGIGDTEKSAWTPCEKWVWSCIRQGLEANLFTKTCVKPRTADMSGPRKKFRLVPFVEPQKYKTSNALSDKFLGKILTDLAYTAQIQPIGIRIFGAYFTDSVNLENVTTGINLVLDGSMARSGLRFTNFKSAKNVSIDGSNVHGSVFLMRARIDGSLFMERSVLDTVDLNDAHIGASVEATGALFNGELRLNRAHIAGKVILTKARLTTLMGWNANIGSSLELRLADVRVGIDLTGSTVDGDVRMPDVTFGRLISHNPRRCDWNPDTNLNQIAAVQDPVDPGHILGNLKVLLPPAQFEAAWGEIVTGRDEKIGNETPNVCEAKSPSLQPDVLHNALLRDMRIKGLLCIMDVTGEIEGPAPPNGAKPSIQTISIDGTESKSAILSWMPTSSLTEWRAVNFKTEYLLVNLEPGSQPKNHYVDNLDIRVFTPLKRGKAPELIVSLKMSDEHLVKSKCNITPGAGTIEDANQRETQNRIIKFFDEDRSGSAQPFSAIVKSLGSSGVNTVHIRKALSALQNRNACTSSEFSKALHDYSWMQFSEIWPIILAKQPAEVSKARYLAIEFRDVVFDGGCAAWQMIHANAVGYGHEPLRLVFWIAAAIAFFWLLLKFDGRQYENNFMRKPLGLAYVVDNLIPLKLYRIDPENADELPNNGFLKWYRSLHRLLGLFFAVMIFVYVYKAST